MCFSATASFTSGAVLVGVGLVSMKRAESSPFKPISTVPLLFGFQQISEGFLWLGLQNDSFILPPQWFEYTFLFFAWIVWPLFIPFSMIYLEPKGIRRTLLMGTQVIGLLVAGALSYVLFFKSINPKILGHSIYYDIHIETALDGVMGILYLLCTVLPPLLSGRKRLWVLGVVTGVLYVIAKIYYEQHLLSVWCFLAAIGSIIVLWIVDTHARETRSVKGSN